MEIIQESVSVEFSNMKLTFDSKFKLYRCLINCAFFILILSSTRAHSYDQNTNSYGSNLGEVKAYNQHNHIEYEQPIKQVIEDESPVEDDRPKIHFGFRLRMPAVRFDLPRVNLPKITVSAKIQQPNTPRTIRLPEINLDTSSHIATSQGGNAKQTTRFNVENSIVSEPHVSSKTNHQPYNDKNNNYDYQNNRLNENHHHNQVASYDMASSAPIASSFSQSLVKQNSYRLMDNSDSNFRSHVNTNKYLVDNIGMPINHDNYFGSNNGMTNNPENIVSDHFIKNDYMQEGQPNTAVLAASQIIPSVTMQKMNPMVASSSEIIQSPSNPAHSIASKPHSSFRTRLRSFFKLA